MITGLDKPSANDPKRVGAKAAALAMARQGGVPILPGFVVETSVSLSHMEMGALALSQRGSGGARLAVSSVPTPAAAQIEAAGRALSTTLAVRSSSPLESDGVWAGAFTSYTDITPEELPKAVIGCWASVFSIDALDRQLQWGIEPGSVPLAILVQPSIDPVVAGVAEISPEGTIRVEAVTGSPGPLLQGWERGVAAARGPDGEWVGAEATALVGVETLDEMGTALATAWSRFGFNRCEWAVADSLWILQLGTVTRPDPIVTPARVTTPADLVPLVQAVMAAPGVLGDEVVLPWAVAGLPDWCPTRVVDDGDLVDQLLETSVGLTSQVWGLPVSEAIPAARSLLARLRGPAAETDIAIIGGLNPPDPDQVSRLLSIIQAIDELLVSRGAVPGRGTVWHLSTTGLRAALEGGPVNAPVRVGSGVWEPLVAAVVLDHGLRFQGVPAAAGIGVGRRHVAGSARLRPRVVVTAPQALPNLSQQIWDAAGLVTDLGSPAAHVFETARSLGVPAVCGVDLGPETGQIVAVDGYSGVVAVLPFGADPIP